MDFAVSCSASIGAGFVWHRAIPGLFPKRPPLQPPCYQCLDTYSQHNDEQVWPFKKQLLPAEYPLCQGATKGQGARSIRARLVNQGLSVCPTRRRHLEAPGQPQPWHQAHSWDGARVRPVCGPTGWPGWVEHGGGEMALLEFHWGRGWWLQGLM